MRGIPAIPGALKHRNYRLFFVGQGISLIGTWMQTTAAGWLVYGLAQYHRLPRPESMLGKVAFCGQIMTFLLAPVAGVLADRSSKRPLLVLTQALALTQATVLAVLALAGWVQIWQIMVLAAVLGLSSAFDIPIRQSFVVEMVDRKADLPSAIALNSFLVNGARIVGPSIAGWIVVAVSAVARRQRPGMGEGVCFAINAASYVAVILSLLSMRLGPGGAAGSAASGRPRPTLLRSVLEGVRYAHGSPPVRSLLMLLAAVALLGMPYGTLLPVFARTILHGDARTQGLLLSAAGVGAVTGAVYLASRRSVLGLGRLIALAPALLGVGLAVFSQSRWLALSLPALWLCGLAVMMQVAATNTLIQTVVDDDKRGRVMSLWSVCFIGMSPFGSLLLGYLGAWLGAPTALLIAGLACLGASGVFLSRLGAIRRAARPIYQRLGLLPPDTPADADPSASADPARRNHF